MQNKDRENRQGIKIESKATKGQAMGEEQIGVVVDAIKV